MVKAAGCDGSPPAATVTDAVPFVAISLAGTAAANCRPATSIRVVSADPFHCTWLSGAKPDPNTVNVKPSAPAGRRFGSRLSIPDATTTVNVAGFDVAVPEVTVIVAVPGVATAELGTEAVTSIMLTTRVVSAVPLQWTTASVPIPAPAPST